MVLDHVSASSVDLFRRCKRAWLNRYVRGLKKPPTKSQETGKEIHAAIEAYLKTGNVEEGPWKAHVEAARPHLPEPGCLVEHEISLDTGIGPKWIGFIDAAECPGLIVDTKTTSDFRYNKTPAELAQNTQVLSYAKWMLDGNTTTNQVTVRHVYVPSKAYKIKAPPVVPVEVDVTREQVEKHWAGCLETVREMVELAAKEPSADDVEPNTNECAAYGGCPYRTLCGLEPLERKGKNMGKAELLAKLQGKAAPTPPVAVGVLPPDAPTRETPQELSAEKAKRAPKTNQDKLKFDESDVTPAALDKPTLVENAPKVKPRLYIDCYPTKGEGAAVLFEDWIAPITKRAAEEHEVSDYRLIRYESKAVLASMIREAVDTCPPVLVIGSYASWANEAIEILAPYAEKIVKALRG